MRRSVVFALCLSLVTSGTVLAASGTALAAPTVHSADQSAPTGANLVPSSTSVHDGPSTVGRPAPISPAGRVDTRAPTADLSTSRHVITERKRLHPTSFGDGVVEVSYTYDVPASVSRLRVTLPVLERSGYELVSVEGFERRDGTTFVWEANPPTPTIRIRIQVGQGQMNGDSSVETDEWAFARLPSTGVRWRYSASARPPSFRSVGAVEGQGVAVSEMAYAGPGEFVRRETAFGTDIRVAVAADAQSVAPVEDIPVSLAILIEDFRLGIQYEETGVFVLPASATLPGVAGQNVGSSYWVQGESASLSSLETTFTHEFAHTRVGSFPDGDSMWLTEGFAEYYQYVLALNQGMGSYTEFRRAIDRNRGEYAPSNSPVVLSEPATWQGTDANYDKGMVVLAALDARIRNATNGRRMLQDVLRVRFRDENNFDGLHTYTDFRAAVVEVSGDESLGPWLDRYVTTDAMPTVPDDPALFVTREDADPDEDGLESGAEIDAGTNPFLPDSDADGVDDGTEAAGPTDPTVADTDGDGLDDRTELNGPTDPTAADTDGDGAVDGEDADPTDPAVTTPTSTPTPESTPTPTPDSTLDDDGDDDDDGGGTATTDATGPAVGPLGALAALVVGIAFLAVRRRD